MSVCNEEIKLAKSNALSFNMFLIFFNLCTCLLVCVKLNFLFPLEHQKIHISESKKELLKQVAITFTPSLFIITENKMPFSMTMTFDQSKQKMASNRWWIIESKTCLNILFSMHPCLLCLNGFSDCILIIVSNCQKLKNESWYKSCHFYI